MSLGLPPLGPSLPLYHSPGAEDHPLPTATPTANLDQAGFPGTSGASSGGPSTGIAPEDDWTIQRDVVQRFQRLLCDHIPLNADMRSHALHTIVRLPHWPANRPIMRFMPGDLVTLYHAATKPVPVRAVSASGDRLRRVRAPQPASTTRNGAQPHIGRQALPASTTAAAAAPELGAAGVRPREDVKVIAIVEDEQGRWAARVDIGPGRVEQYPVPPSDNAMLDALLLATQLTDPSLLPLMLEGFPAASLECLLHRTDPDVRPAAARYLRLNVARHLPDAVAQYDAECRANLLPPPVPPRRA